MLQSREQLQNRVERAAVAQAYQESITHRDALKAQAAPTTLTPTPELDPPAATPVPSQSPAPVIASAPKAVISLISDDEDEDEIEDDTSRPAYTLTMAAEEGGSPSLPSHLSDDDSPMADVPSLAFGSRADSRADSSQLEREFVPESPQIDIPLAEILARNRHIERSVDRVPDDTEEPVENGVEFDTHAEDMFESDNESDNLVEIVQPAVSARQPFLSRSLFDSGAKPPKPPRSLDRLPKFIAKHKRRLARKAPVPVADCVVTYQLDGCEHLTEASPLPYQGRQCHWCPKLHFDCAGTLLAHLNLEHEPFKFELKRVVSAIFDCVCSLTMLA